MALPASGREYRALDDSERLAVAVSCRDRAADRAGAVAADELGRVDADELREQLDALFASSALCRDCLAGAAPSP